MANPTALTDPAPPGYETYAVTGFGFAFRPIQTGASQATQDASIATLETSQTAQDTAIVDLQSKISQSVHASYVDAVGRAESTGRAMGLTQLNAVDAYITSVPQDAEVQGDFNAANFELTLTNDKDGTSTTFVVPEAAAGVVPLTDPTATTGAEHTEMRGMSLEQVDQRIMLNGNEIDLAGQTNQPLQTRKLHVVDNTTTLDLAPGAAGDRAWTWNTQTEQLDFYRHDGTSYIPDAPDHDHEVLENIAIAVRSAGTNAGSAVQIEFFDLDGVAYPATDWTVSTAPITGLEAYTSHGPLFLSDVAYSGSVAILHNKQGFLFFKYVGDNANGLSAITYAGTNGANADGQIIVNFVGTNYHKDFANKAAVTATDFTKEAPAEAAAKAWVFSTDNMIAADGDKIIVQPNHNIAFPGVADLESVQLAPSTGNWSDIAAGTGAFTPDAAWTFGVNQSLLFGSDIITAIANLGSTNWLLLSGGEDAPSQDARFETVALLPAPATVNPGAVAVVYGDPTPANNKPYTARTDGVTQTVAVAWS